MRTDEIHIRDPFVLTVHEESGYYLFGSTDPNIWAGPGVGFDCYRSADLNEWEGPMAAFRPPVGFWSPTQYWAPEVHRHDGRWFMLATFGSHDGSRRGTAVLVADRPQGPYEPWSAGPVTPPGWLSLDGTLYVDRHHQPWMVFCHEWVQVGDGEVCAVRLREDLRAAAGDPVLLFRASEAGWTRSLDAVEHASSFVTDGPFLHRTPGGSLVMLWSSFSGHGYALGRARSSSGEVLGHWEHENEALWSHDGGHGMLFRTLDGRLRLALHAPNTTPNERAVFIPVVESADDVGL